MTFDLSIDLGKLVRFPKVDVGREEGEAVCEAIERDESAFSRNSAELGWADQYCGRTGD